MDEYYISKNGEEFGPFLVEDIVGKVGRGSLERGDLCWKEGMVEWEPIHLQIELPPPLPRSPAPTIEEKIVAGRFWEQKVTCWPNAFLFSFVLFFFVVYLIGKSPEPRALDWHLYLLDAFICAVAFAITLVALKALRDARKKQPLKSKWSQVTVGLLLGLLYLWMLIGAFVPINAVLAINAFSKKQVFLENAPSEFLLSIESNQAQPNIGNDAQILKEMILIQTQNFYNRSQPNLSANDPMAMQKFQYQGSATGNTYDDKIGLLRQIDLNSISTPPVAELLVNTIGFYEYLRDEHSNAHSMSYNPDPYAVYDDIADATLRLREADQIIGEIQQRTALFFGFTNWQTLEHFTLKGEMPESIGDSERSKTQDEQIDDLIARFDEEYGEGVAYRGPKWWADVVDYFTLPGSKQEAKIRFEESLNLIRAE